MKNDFNLEQTLGKIAQSIANKRFRDDFKTPLGKLLDMPGNPAAAEAFTSAVEVLSEYLGKQHTLFLLDELLGQKHEDSADFRLLQKWMMKKWETNATALAAENADAALNYAGIAARNKKPDHPLAETVAKYWGELVDRQEMKDEFTVNYHLNPDGAASAYFRREVLIRLAAFSDNNPLLVFGTLNKLIEKSNFFSFNDTDIPSVKLIAVTMAHLLKNHGDKLDDRQKQDIAWKLMSHLKTAGDATVTQGARAYFLLAQREPELERGYQMFSGLIEQRSEALAPYALLAKNELLEKAAAGAYNGAPRVLDEVARVVSEKIFYPAIDPASKDDAVAERAASTLLGLARTALQKKGSFSDYQYLNAAAAVYDFFPSGDPRGVEAVELWKSAAKSEHKPRDHDGYYMNSMGWLFESASRKGDAENAAYALAEWKEALDALTAKAAAYGYKAVQELLSRETQQPGKINPVLVAEAQARLPALEKAAGVVFLPDQISPAEFKQVLQQYRKQPKPKPQA